MAQQSLMWTALPNGYTPDGNSLRVSVMLSPRLDAQSDPQELGSFFPDWEDWPATLAKASFTITYGNHAITIPATQTAGANRVDTSNDSFDSPTWKALFNASVFVRGFQYKDLSNNLILSYDTTTMASLVQNLYGKLASKANGEMPKVSDIADDPEWKNLVSIVSSLDERFTNRETGVRDPKRQFGEFLQGELASVNNMAETLARFQLFHTPALTPQPVTYARKEDLRVEASWLEYERKDMPKAEDLAKQLDFHQIIAAMNHYPALLRRLGIVIDFIIDASLFAQSSNSLLSVSVQFPPGTLEIPRANDVSPGTHTLLSASKFQAVSSPLLLQDDMRILDGLLDLNLNQYDVLQADVDGSGLKVMNFARSLKRLSPDPARIDPVTRFEKDLGVPSLRNAGFMLVHRNRGPMLKNRFATNKVKNLAAEMVFSNQPNAVAPELWAEDIVRGYRIDIWDSTTNVWRSLCQRKSTYDLNDGMVVVKPPEEEGTVRLASTKSSDPASNQEIVYLHEALVSWTGWSLAVPPPGRAILPGDKVDESTAQTEAKLPPGLKFKSTFRVVQNTLPRLRIGRSYWLRARAVDLAGNSLLPQEKDFGPENPSQNARMYLRHDPLLPPVIALVRPHGGATEKPAEGESMERIAIRSFNDTPADNTVVTGQAARRFAVPPQSSVKDAEVHGRLDAGGGLDKSKYDMLANQKDRDAKDPNASLQEETIPMQGPLDPTPVDTTFAVYRDGESMTYLPDPIAEEVAVRVFDHPNISDTEIITVPLYQPGGKWPDAQPFKIKVFEHPSDKPKYEESTRTLLVPLPKAIRAKVRLSTKLAKAWRDRMGVWQWLTAADKAKLDQLSLDGQHWMLTPWRTVEVVHAVQRPLVTPQISQLNVRRGYADTFATPAFVATCSLKSTDRLDLLAEWHEPEDDPAKSEKIQLNQMHGDVAFSVKVTDRKSYSMRIFGNERGGYAEHMIIGDDLISVNVIAHDLALPKNHEFHDTRYRRIEYWLEGTTKFREYMPGSILTEMVSGKNVPTEKNIKVTGPSAVTWVRSSAPPPAPEVLYIVPTFGWVRTKNAEGDQSSWRRGGGLRVYLDRPWNVSGYGEMLGVVLPPQNFAGDPEVDPKGNPYKKYVTQWGNDPIWLSPFVSGIAPERDDFPLARFAPDPTGKWLPKGAPDGEKDQPPGPFNVTSLPAPGTPSSPVDVAPHDVFYDEERRLWYCDIEINHGAAYYPFIRLALARYQPASLNGAHLSNIVLADFMSLAADRWLNVTHTADANKRHVAIYGNSYRDSSAHVEAAHAPSMSLIDRITNTPKTIKPADVSATSVIEVWVERLNEDEGEDFGWKKISNAVVQPKKPATRRAITTRAATRTERARSVELLRRREFDLLARERLTGSILLFAPLWEGDVTLPSEAAGARYRLVIAEYEEYLVDDDLPYDEVPEKKDRRLVFVEHIELA